MRLGISRTSRRRTRHGGRLGIILFAAMVFAGIMITILIRLQPVVIDYAEKYASSVADSVVNKAIQEVYSDGDYSYTTEISGKSVRTVETDTAKINRLKSALNQALHDGMSECETVYIPLGSALNWYFLSGMGPKIPIKICPIGVINMDLRDDFSSEGINQVYHKIYLDVTLEMSYIGLMSSRSQTVRTTALVSETVIVGDTPEYYGTGEIAVE